MTGPTIVDVAAAAGVTPSTVSRAFNGGSIRESTRLRILAAASQLGYVGNEAARQLRGVRATGIGVIVRDLSNYYTSSLLTSIVARIQQAGRQMMLGNFDNALPDNERIMRKFVAAAAGIIVVSPGADAMDLVRECDPRTTVLANYRLDGYASVVPDDATGMEQAVRHLMSLQHRRIAFVNGPAHSQTGSGKQRAFVDICTRLGIEAVTIGPFPATHRSGFAAADMLLTLPRVTAAIVYNDILASGVMARLAERGIAIPQRFSVIGIDDSLVASLVRPQLTSINNRQGDVGDTAARLLLGQLAAADRCRGAARTRRKRAHGEATPTPAAQVQAARMHTAHPQPTHIQLNETLTIRKSTGPAFDAADGSAS